MTTAMPALTTDRLLIRPFVLDDLDPIHRILDHDFLLPGSGEAPLPREERKAWLIWAIANYEQLGKLYQPPYGDRAIVRRDSGEVIGACGLVPTIAPFGQIPLLTEGKPERSALATPEVGLFYALSRDHRGKGYATEAARALVDYAFRELKLRRIIATTTYENAASMGVMQRLGMTIDRNPFPEPPWFQVVGVLENSRP